MLSESVLQFILHSGNNEFVSVETCYIQENDYHLEHFGPNDLEESARKKF